MAERVTSEPTVSEIRFSPQKTQNSASEMSLKIASLGRILTQNDAPPVDSNISPFYSIFKSFLFLSPHLSPASIVCFSMRRAFGKPAFFHSPFLVKKFYDAPQKDAAEDAKYSRQ